MSDPPTGTLTVRFTHLTALLLIASVGFHASGSGITLRPAGLQPAASLSA